MIDDVQWYAQYHTLCIVSAFVCVFLCCRFRNLANYFQKRYTTLKIDLDHEIERYKVIATDNMTSVT